MPRPAAILIGISGWTYPPWRGHFYPADLPHRLELAYASRTFPSIEINGTFYRLQKPEAFERWDAETPKDFIFAVKAPRFITHVRRLREPITPLANFFASGLLRLGPKLGPILWQLPPSFRFDAERIGPFLALLPHDTEAAAHIARSHDDRLKGRTWLKTDAVRPLRHAVEIRHESFRDKAFIDLLCEHAIALVCADTVEWPRLMDLTADFVYCLLHGSEELYRSGYDEAALERWAGRVEAWSRGEPMLDGEFVVEPSKQAERRDVYLYFDNTDKLCAPYDAQALMRRLGMMQPAGGGRDAATPKPARPTKPRAQARRISV